MAERESWGSRFGFIMATAGFSVGLGSVWRFPYKVSVNGGGAFLLIYILIATFICVPLFLAEMGLGRKTKLDAIRGMRSLAGKGSFWVAIGWMGCVASLFIMSYYFMIMGWTFAYTVKAGLGVFESVTTPEQAAAVWTAFSQNPWEVLGYMAAMIVLTGWFLVKGLRAGIERACSWMLPFLFVIIVVLAVRSMTLPNSEAGLAWYLTPDFTKVSGSTILDALGQAFFAVGIGVATAFLYGSYLSKDSNLPADTAIIVGLVTLVAFLCGLIIFPALSAFGMPNASGPALVYETMPLIFNQMFAGKWLATLFFLLCLLAGLTSAFGYVEAVAATMAGVFGLGRKQSTWGTLAVMFLMGIPCVMAIGPWKEWKVALDMDFFALFDFISGNILMPLGALMIALYTACCWGFNAYMEENNVGAASLRVTSAWKPLVVAAIPLAVGAILVTGLMPLL